VESKDCGGQIETLSQDSGTIMDILQPVPDSRLTAALLTRGGIEKASWHQLKDSKT